MNNVLQIFYQIEPGKSTVDREEILIDQDCLYVDCLYWLIKNVDGKTHYVLDWNCEMDEDIVTCFCLHTNIKLCNASWYFPTDSMDTYREIKKNVG